MCSSSLVSVNEEFGNPFLVVLGKLVSLSLYAKRAEGGEGGFGIICPRKAH